VSEEEVANARDYLVGVLPLQMQTTGQLAGALADLVTYGLPLDYYDHYRARMAAVSADDVRRAARAHLRPDQYAIIVVGDTSAVRDGIEALQHGPLQQVTLNGEAA